MRRSILILLCVAVMLAAASWTPAVAAQSSGSALILYDSDSGGAWGWLGEIYSKQLASLLGHFELPYEIAPVESYAKGGIDSHLATFYIGSLYDTPLPDAFVSDVLASTQPICWLKYNLWQVAQGGTGSPNRAFEAKFGFRFLGVDLTAYDEVLYKGETFTRHPGNTDIGAVEVLDPGICAVMAIAQVSAAAASSPPPPPTPYIVRGGNLWYVADMPFAYVSEEDRYIVFADLLHDMLGMDHPQSHRALIRIEDVDPTVPPTRLREIADYLSSQSIPFAVSVIPVYADPFGVYNGGTPQRAEMSQEPDFLDALRYMAARGGRIILHGYTHQYDAIENPFTALTGDDFEFYRVTLDERGGLVYQGPLAEDAAGWAQARIDAARREAAASLVGAAAWETPHYTASAADYETFAANFPLTVGRVPYFADSEPLYFGGQIFPYVIYRDFYGQTIVPENLGSIDLVGWSGFGRRLPADLVRAAAKNLVVRDGWASAYYHPFLDLQYLKDTVTGIRDLGYVFVDLAGDWDDEIPVAEAGVASPDTVNPGESVSFDAGASYCPRPERAIAGYQWDWDSDGVYDATGATVSHVFEQPGEYLVTLRVTDDATPAHAATDSTIVRVIAPASPPPVSGILTGTVKDRQTNAALAGATVSAYLDGALMSSDTSDDAGVYRIDTDLAAGTYKVTVARPGYVRQAKTAVVTSGARTYCSFFMLPSGVLSGTVKDRDTLAPIAGVTIRAYLGGVLKATATSNDAGGYRITSDLPAGTYAVTAAKAGRVSVTKGAFVSPGTVAYASFFLLPSGVLSGTVKDRDTLAPIAGATVKAYLGGVLKATAKTNSLGGYRITSDLPAGTYSVTGSQDGYMPVAKPAVVAPGSTTYASFFLAPSGILTGMVRDAGSNAPIAGATVSAYLGGVLKGSAVTNGSGLYRIAAGLPGGSYLVTAAKDGYVTGSRSGIGVVAGSTTGCSLFLTPSGIP